MFNCNGLRDFFVCVYWCGFVSKQTGYGHLMDTTFKRIIIEPPTKSPRGSSAGLRVRKPSLTVVQIFLETALYVYYERQDRM